MNDSELKELFSKLKTADANKAPDFDILLSKPKPQLKKKLKLISVFKWSAAAAAVISLGFIGYRTYNITENKCGETLAEEQKILNWESETDVLMPTEYSQLAENSQTIELNTVTSVSKSEIKEIIRKNPEISEADYSKGAISDWESPTTGLLPPDITFSYYME